MPRISGQAQRVVYIAAEPLARQAGRYKESVPNIVNGANREVYVPTPGEQAEAVGCLLRSLIAIAALGAIGIIGIGAAVLAKDCNKGDFAPTTKIDVQNPGGKTVPMHLRSGQNAESFCNGLGRKLARSAEGLTCKLR